VSHDPGELLQIADRSWKIHQGELTSFDPHLLLSQSEAVAV
jgi:hypothetical protein